MKTLQSMFLSEASELLWVESRLQPVYQKLESSSSCKALAGILSIQCFEAARRGSRIEHLVEGMGVTPRSRTSTILEELTVLFGSLEGGRLPADQLLLVLFRIYHYLLASYGCLRDWAALLGNEVAAWQLHESCDEIRAFEATLVHLARGEGFNPPLRVRGEESRRPLARLLSARERAVLHWLAVGMAKRHAGQTAPAQRTLRADAEVCTEPPCRRSSPMSTAKPPRCPNTWCPTAQPAPPARASAASAR